MKKLIAFILLFRGLALYAQLINITPAENIYAMVGDTVWVKAEYPLQNNNSPKQQIQRINIQLKQFAGSVLSEKVHKVTFYDRMQSKLEANGIVDTFFVIPGNWPVNSVNGYRQWYLLELYYSDNYTDFSSSNYKYVLQSLYVAPYTNCKNVYQNDTISYSVCSEEFSSISPVVFYENTKTIPTFRYGCDSIVSRYVKYEFKELDKADTIFLTETISHVDTVRIQHIVPFDSLITIDVVDTIPVIYEEVIKFEHGLYLDLRNSTLASNILFEKEQFHFYPNPTTDILHYEFHSQIKTVNPRSLHILDIQGVELYSVKVKNTKSTIKTLGIGPVGMYIIQVRDEKGYIIHSEVLHIK